MGILTEPTTIQICRIFLHFQFLFSEKNLFSEVNCLGTTLVDSKKKKDSYGSFNSTSKFLFMTNISKLDEEPAMHNKC